LEEEERSKGGIIIPDAAKEKPKQGKVIAVGKGKALATKVANRLRGTLKVTVLARMFHGSTGATADIAVLPGVLGCYFDRLRPGRAQRLAL